MQLNNLAEIIAHWTEMGVPENQVKQWAEKAYGVLQTAETSDDFEDFCVTEKAVKTAYSTVYWEYYVDPRNQKKRELCVPYDIFKDVWKLLEKQREQREYASEQKWVGMDILDSATQDSHIQAFIRGLEKAKIKLQANGQNTHQLDLRIEQAQTRLGSSSQEAARGAGRGQG